MPTWLAPASLFLLLLLLLCVGAYNYMLRPVTFPHNESRPWAPIVVALFAAFLGYAATHQATTVAERAVSRDSMAEVLSVAESAAEHYARFLTSIDDAYVAAISVITVSERLERLRRFDENPSLATLLALIGVAELPARSQSDSDFINQVRDRLPAIRTQFMSSLNRDTVSLIDRLSDIRTALRDITTDALARTCFRQQWQESALRVSAIVHRFDDQGDPLANIAADYTRAGQGIQLGVNNLTAGLELLEVVGPGRYARQLNAATDATRQLRGENGERPNAAYRVVVFLGNILGYFDEVRGLYGAAIIADLIDAVPNRKQFRACLEDYFADNNELLAASREYVPQFDPMEVTPSLLIWLAEMEERGLQYVAEDMDGRAPRVAVGDDPAVGVAEAAAVSGGARNLLDIIRRRFSGDVPEIDADRVQPVVNGEPASVRLLAGTMGQLRLVVEDGAVYRIEASGVASGVDPYVYLYRAEEGGTLERVAVDDDGGDGNDARIERSLDPGTYYVVVEDVLGRAGSCTVSVERVGES